MSDKLSQEDIDRLLSGNNNDSSSTKKYLNEIETDIIGEIGNISMGSAATTMSLLVGNKVDITTPTVKEYSDVRDVFNFPKDFVTVEIKYKVGLNGTTVFCLNTLDTTIISDLMMGGSGDIKEPNVGELQLSAVGEAMNQMIGTVATTLASMFSMNIDITPPDVKLQSSTENLELSEEVFAVPIIAVCFNLKIEGLIDSEMMQFMPLSTARTLIEKSMNLGNQPEPEPVKQVVSPPPLQQQAQQQSQHSMSQPMSSTSQSNNFYQEPQRQPVTVQPVQFASFDNMENTYGANNKNLDLVMDVKLKLSVELGRAELSIKKILELTRGSVIELDKVAGEPVELFANGKLIAKGEVVVIEDNFGLRVTNILSPDNIMKNI